MSPGPGTPSQSENVLSCRDPCSASFRRLSAGGPLGATRRSVRLDEGTAVIGSTHAAAGAGATVRIGAVPLLTRERYLATMSDRPSRVDVGARPPVDFWGYVDRVPLTDLGGHDFSGGDVSHAWNTVEGQ